MKMKAETGVMCGHKSRSAKECHKPLRNSRKQELEETRNWRLLPRERGPANMDFGLQTFRTVRKHVSII